MANCESRPLRSHRVANCESRPLRSHRMAHHASRITYYVLVLSLLLTPLTASAQGINVIESQAEHSFAQQITFTLRATSDAEITTAYLFFRAAGDEQTQSVPIEDFEPGREISASYTHDVRLSPLPPFAQINFWWRIEDDAGNQLTTDPQRTTYTDNRFRWEQVSDGAITVHWVEGHGDPAFGQAAIDVARTSVEEIEAELHVPSTEPIAIYIYDARHNRDAAMLLTGREWVVGQAHPELGVVIVAIPYEEGYTSRMARYIPHEITHMLVYQAVTPAGYRYIPEWLDEGLAMSNERLPTPEFALVLEEARAAGQLLPLESLCVPFAPDLHTTPLAYAQSGSVVRFMRERYGAAKIRALLTAYANGASCASGVQDALNISLSGLDTAWRVSLEPQSPWHAWVDQIGVWVGLWLLSLLVAAPMVGKLRT